MQRAQDRPADTMRSVTVTRRYLKHAHGSCLFELGDTKVLCAASMSDGVAGWRKGKGLGWVTAEYALLPASTHTRSRRESTSGGPRGRTHEIQRLIGRSIRSVVDMSAMGGEFTLNVDCDVIQADGGTRTAAITGAWVALYDCIQWMKLRDMVKDGVLRDHIAAVSCGLYKGTPVLDLDYAEDSAADADSNFVMTGAGGIVEVQGTAETVAFSQENFDQLMVLARKGIAELVELQKLTVA